MSADEYRLSADEFALAIHRALCEIYPDCRIDGQKVREMVIHQDDNNVDLIFKAEELAAKYQLKASDMIDRLELELNIEYEKNWHDRAFYHIIRDEKAIRFIAVDGA